MNTWKSSTLLVAAAFMVSVILLFTKSGMMRERATTGRPLITNHIYSPAAADPDLRNQARAERMSRQEPRAEKVATHAVVIREPATVKSLEIKSSSEASATPLPTPAKTAVKTAATETVVPDADHRYYVVAGTFSTLENAQKGLLEFKSKGLSHSFIGVFNEGKYTSVIARAFEQENQARLMLKELKEKHNISGYIYHKVD